MIVSAMNSTASRMRGSSRKLEILVMGISLNSIGM
jgi:hypothetical protein